ncbi:putative reverse transcriptase domain-containing protein [Tanacetum coccineum]|uniref:Reverse transcriptase domain-containing protein n=1 Tax=Tanacetum coccineum TaxID=301880 RepID=A0ABQ5CV06_9ASTR
MQEVILFYNGLEIPTRQILDSRGAIPSKTIADAKVAIQEMVEYSQKWHNGTSRSRSTETFDGLAAIQAQLNNLGREIKKVNEKIYAAQVGCEQCKGPHYTKDFPLKEEGKTLEEAYYTQFERRQSMEDTLRKFMCESAKRHEENSNLIKEIRASTDAAIRNQGASIKTLEIQIGQMSKELGKLAHTKLTVELANRTVKYPKGIAENVLVRICKFTFPIDFIILDMPNDIKVPLILGRPFLSTARAKIDVYKRKITLRVGEERIIFTSVKLASSLIKRVYMLSLRERMELDLEARLMGETLVLNRSLDPFFEDYIELNDLNEPFELRRNQGDDLMPTIEEGELIEEFRTRDDKLDAGIDDYPSYCDYDKKIHIDCARNLKFSCMIGFEFTHTNFFPLLYVNVMSKKFHNSIMKDKMMYKGHNVIGALMNVPIFVGTFSAMMDFAVLENMDDYCDEEMGDVIFGEPFLKEVGIKTRLFKGMIIIYDGDNEVTYQIVRSNLRFKLHTNKQCNKIPPLLKVSKEDKINEISHPYKKLKGFYKGVLNLGPDYIRDARIEEWLTREHISLHEME